MPSRPTSASTATWPSSGARHQDARRSVREHGGRPSSPTPTRSTAVPEATRSIISRTPCATVSSWRRPGLPSSSRRLKGDDYASVAVESKHFREIKIASAIHGATRCWWFARKGARALRLRRGDKNVAMGCAPPSGKQMLHSDMKPKVLVEKCTSCGMCIKRCPADAIRFDENKKANIDRTPVQLRRMHRICAYEAIPVIWTTDHRRFTSGPRYT